MENLTGTLCAICQGRDGRHYTDCMLVREPWGLAGSGQWRDVKVELPPVGEYVHLLVDGNVQLMPACLALVGFAGREGKRWEWLEEESDPMPFENATHWQPLPLPPAGGSGAPAGKDLTFLAQKLINYHHPSYESCAVCSEVIVELCGPQPSPAAGSGDKPAEANYVQEVDKSITGQEPSCQVCGAVMTILYRPSGVTCYECLSCGATSQPIEPSNEHSSIPPTGRAGSE